MKPAAQTIRIIVPIIILVIIAIYEGVEINNLKHKCTNYSEINESLIDSIGRLNNNYGNYYLKAEALIDSIYWRYADFSDAIMEADIYMDYENAKNQLP